MSAAARGDDPHRAAPRTVTVTWYGQSGFLLEAGRVRVLIDPFLSERDGRLYPPPAPADRFADVGIVLCTHEHADHLDVPFLRELAAVNPEAPIVVPAPVTEIAAAAGLDRGRLTGAAPGETLREAGVTVHPVPALHGIGGGEPVAYEFAPGGGQVRFLGYVVEIGGVRVYHAGDCLLYPELPQTLAGLAPDVLMVPVNGRDHMREAGGIVGNMNEAEAAWLCARVNPGHAIPMHYDAISGNTGDPGRFAALVRESGCAAAVVLPPRARPVVLAVPG
ncbi:MAG TPA: MBL fold metallo-hydrolase [Streptosporangiaceae bacterium]|nr:MBL fold metallo-hydrolase [Streptosporangiaceae bacterium]